MSCEQITCNPKNMHGRNHMLTPITCKIFGLQVFGSFIKRLVTNSTVVCMCWLTIQYQCLIEKNCGNFSVGNKVLIGIIKRSK